MCLKTTTLVEEKDEEKYQVFDEPLGLLVQSEKELTNAVNVPTYYIIWHIVRIGTFLSIITKLLIQLGIH